MDERIQGIMAGRGRHIVAPRNLQCGQLLSSDRRHPRTPTIDEVETMFHEFGHGLHGMLSRARLKSQAGTNVDRDFVELPSQIHEHWAFEARDAAYLRSPLADRRHYPC